MESWLVRLATEPDSFQALKAADFWFGAIGFVITICGFYIAWIKLSRVQVAAKAAEDALLEFRFRVQRYEATSDLSVAQYALTSIGRAGDDYSARDMVDMLSDVSGALGRVIPVVRLENEEVACALDKSKISVERTISRLEREDSGNNRVTSATLRKLSRATMAVLHSSGQVLQDKIS